MRDEAVIPVCAFTGLACIFVVLRLYARLFLVGGLQIDDYLIAASFVSIIPLSLASGDGKSETVSVTS